MTPTLQLSDSELDGLLSGKDRAALSDPDLDAILSAPAPTKARFTGQELGLPGIPKPPIPQELETPEQTKARRIANIAPVFINPRTGVKSYGEDTGTGPLGFLDAPVLGIQQIARGVAATAEPLQRTAPLTAGPTSIVPSQPPAVSPEEQTRLSRQFAGGATDVLAGATRVAEPLMAAGVAVAPVESAIALGAGMLSQAGTETLLKKLDVPDEYAAFGSTIAGLVGATGGVALTGLPGMLRNVAFRARVRRILQDKLNADFAERQASERATRESAGQPKQIEGDVAAAAPKPEENVKEAEFEDILPAPRIAKVSDAELDEIVSGHPEKPAPGGLTEPLQVSPEGLKPTEQTTTSEKPSNVAEPVEAGKPVGIETGKSYNLKTGNYTVKAVEAGRVTFDVELPDGTVMAGKKLPESVFSKMVTAAPAPNDAVPTPTAEVQPPLTTTPNGEISPQIPTEEKPVESAPEKVDKPASNEVEKGELETTKPKETYDFASTQATLPRQYAEPVRKLAAKIKTTDLADKGREDEPHLTLLYGLEDEDPSAVQKLLEGEGPIKAKVKTASVFPADKNHPDYDVVKLSVESPDLNRLNEKLKTLPHTSTTGKFNPHITLGYVRKGLGKKYAGWSAPGLSGKEITLNEVHFSNKAGEKTPIQLKGKPAEGSAEVVKLKESLAQTGFDKPYSELTDGQKESVDLRAARRMAPRVVPDKKPVTPQVVPEKKGPVFQSLKSPELAAREDFPVGTKVEFELAGKTRQGEVFRETEVGSPRVWVRATNGTELGVPVSRLREIESKETEKPVRSALAKEGDKVEWTTRSGEKLTGTVRSIDSEEGTASVDTDQIVKIAGRIPIGRVETVPLHKLAKDGMVTPEAQSGSYVNNLVNAQKRHYAGRYRRYLLGEVPAPALPGEANSGMWPDLKQREASDIRASLDQMFGKAQVPKTVELAPEEILPEKAQSIGARIRQEWADQPDWYQDLPADRPPWEQVVDAYAKFREDHPVGYTQHIKDFAADFVYGTGDARWYHSKPLETPVEKPTMEAGNEPAAASSVEPVRAPGGEPLESELSQGVSAPREGEPVAPSGGESRAVRKPRKRAGAREGDELEPGGGTVSGVVGNPAEPERTFPPRAQDVNSSRHERDYRIPDGRVVSGSPESRARVNIDAIKTLRQIEAENRPATVQEQEVLAKYVGWGAVPQLFAGRPEFVELQKELQNLLSEEEYSDARRSTTNAHYTGDLIVDAIWKAVQHFGAKPGMSWLEPAIGVGNFFGRQPAELLDGARRVGLDKEPLAGGIAKLLYPDSGIEVVAFEDAGLPKDYFDAAISNVPFGNFGVHDPEFRGKGYITGSIHNYFFAKALTHVRPGGVVAFVTSRYTMDSYEPAGVNLRKWLSERAHLVGAIRLPSGTFRQNAGTDVITDVIFLRKKLPDDKAVGQSWENSNRKILTGGQYGASYPVSINEYYAKNPQHILGKESLTRGQFSDHDYDIKGSATPEQIQAAIESFSKIGFADWTPGKRLRTVALQEVKGSEGAKLGGLFFDEKGNLLRRTSKGAAEPVDVGTGVAKRIRGQLSIRDALKKLLDAELSNKANSYLDVLRRNLNHVYDRYAKENGPLSNQSNTAVMKGDPDAPLLVSLERKFNKGNKSKGLIPSAEKAPIFSRRMLRPAETPSSVGDPKEALYISLNETGRIDWNRMGELTGRTPEQLQSDLAGLVYQEPAGKTWQTAEEYLSGSVRKKLKEARAITKIEPQYKANVEALEKAQPEDIQPGHISALLGVTWVPLDTYGEFATELLGAERPVGVKYVAGNWIVDPGYGNRLNNIRKWSTARVGATDILSNSLNMARIKVIDRDSDGKTSVNPDETKVARARQMELQDHFEKWLFSDPKRADAMARLYNDTQNDLRLRTFDGAHLTLPGMSRDAAVIRGGDLDPHQKAAVWRQIVQPNVLLAHSVGAGKTFEMIAAAMELKRLGLIQRPMFVVPNATLTSWQTQFAALYPQARALVFSEKDLEKSARQRAMAQIATGDWDAVVVPHSSFQFLATGDEIFEEHFNQLEHELTEQLQEATEAGLDTRQIKRMEKAKERLLTSLRDRRNADKKDQTVTWEQLGIDQMFIDEFHEFKKLGFATKQGNVAGIDQEGNQKTFDLLMKLRYTQKHGRGVVGATGTPITNTMGELYTVMRYLIEPELQARGLGRFDEWAANFGRTVDVFEPKIEGGGYQMKARFAQFVNIPELAQLLRSFADVVTSDMIDLPRPEIAGGKRQAVETQLTPDQDAYLEELRDRAKSIRADPRGSLPDNMLSVYTDAGKMAMDIRMVQPGAADDPNGRLNVAADNIYQLWKDSAKNKGAQLVMSDMGKPAEAGGNKDFSAYDELINKLVERGIPRDEISHIYQAKNKAQRARLFQDVNDGKIRVVLGSTQKMGVGVNIQQRLYAMHHLDVPHRPSDLEQREGRILRQGNENPEVHLFYYVTKGSLDEAKFANVVRKAKFINQVMQGKSEVREAEDVGGMVPSLEMFQAMASGDPRVMRKMEVDAEVDRLSGVYSGWKNQQYKIRRDLSEIPGRIGHLKNRVEVFQRDMTIRDKSGERWSVGKQKFEGEKISKDVNEALLKEVIKVANKKGEDVEIGTARSLPLLASMRGYGENGFVKIDIGDGLNVTISAKDMESSGIDIFRRVNNQIDGIDKDITDARANIERVKTEQRNLENSVEENWPYAGKFQELVEEQKQLVKDLGADKGDDAAAVMGEGGEITDKSVEAQEPEVDDSEEDDKEEDKQPLGLTHRKTGERGSAPILTDLAQWLHDQFKDEHGKVNYSGLGALQTRGVRNLSQLGKASESTHEAAVRAASSRGQASTILRAAIPEILKTLEGSDFSWPELRLALIESRLRGLRERWSNFASQVRKMNDVELEETYSNLTGLLDSIEGKRGLPQDLSQTAAALVQSKDWEALREFLGATFEDASAAVTTAMEPDWYDAVTDDRQVQKALGVYKRLVERPMAENHGLNEGVFSTALGPLDTYYPLIPTERKQVQGAGRRLPYRKPRNIANAFATGMSEAYDPSMDALRQRLAAAVRANDKAALIDSLQENGLLRKLSRNEPAPDTFRYRGEEYQAERVELSAGKLLIENGKTTPIPGVTGIMPRWLARELRPILEREQISSPTVLDKLARVLNTISLAGPADFVFHTANLLGTLIANTPFIEKSPTGKILSVPMAKKFFAIAKIAMTDPTTEQAARELVEMARIGVVPDRYGSETYSKRLAEEFGAQQKPPFVMGPLLYGPKGIDIRARLIMYRLAKSINPDASAKQLRDFVNQLGNYVPSLQGEIERTLKSTGLSPFYTAGSTMIRNGVNAWLGTGPMPKSGPGLRAWQQITGGALATLALWAFIYHQVTGKWPWEDRRAKLLQIPAPDAWRRSDLGKKLWGEGQEVGYLNFGYFNPLVSRGGRALGVSGAFETRVLGGNTGQQMEAAQRDTLNSILHPILGPIPRALFVGATGVEPYITGFRDRSGRVGLSFFPAIPPKTKPGLPALGRRTLAAASELNAFYGQAGAAVGQSTGFLGEPAVAEKGNKWVRMIIDTSGIGTGAISNATNPHSRANTLRQQRTGTR